jgi:hypothetical protein
MLWTAQGDRSADKIRSRQKLGEELQATQASNAQESKRYVDLPDFREVHSDLNLVSWRISSTPLRQLPHP